MEGTYTYWLLVKNDLKTASHFESFWKGNRIVLLKRQSFNWRDIYLIQKSNDTKFIKTEKNKVDKNDVFFLIQNQEILTWLRLM